MTAERTEDQLLSMQDFLVWEETHPERHEYVGGVVYAMAGGSQAHAEIAMNIGGLLHGQLRGKPCRPYGPDMKLRIQFATHTRFYYPDAMVVCIRNATGDPFQDHPAVILEVASESTRRTDEQEKRDAYQAITTLRVYALFEQDRAAVTLWRRGEQGFARETYEGLDAVIALPEIEARLVLAEAYESVRLG